MKRAAVYIESSVNGVLGGAQTHAAVLVEWLSRSFAVDVLVRSSAFDLAALAAASTTDLSSARTRIVSVLDDACEMRIDGSYDLFVAFVHALPPPCPAPRGLLFVLFPLVDKAQLWPWSHSQELSVGKWRVALRESLHGRRWRRRFEGYQIQTANSEFTRRWTKRRWGLDCDVVYPPVEVEFDAMPKRQAILSVGRFAGTGVNKSQREMLQSYATLRGNPLWPQSWSYDCVGALSSADDDQRYFEYCHDAALRSNATLHTNLDRTDLRRLYGQSSIFWHAAGIDLDESIRPEMAEHFGMVTVEAMANGCVPVVARRGGQPEIVQHGENGLLCESLEEIRSETLCLATDQLRMEALSLEARRSAARFSRAAFLETMEALFRRQGWLPEPENCT